MCRKLLKRTHPVSLSITHNVDLHGCAEGYVVEPGEAALHDDVSRRRVLGAGEIATKPSHLGEIALLP